MSIRVIVLYFFITFLCIYAWKDWFKSLCGLIVLMAIISHGDMPTTVFGIQGLNPWNVLFTIIFLAWLASRRSEGLTWDMPRHISVLLLMYLVVILVGVLRAVFDRSHIEDYPLGGLISEELINTVKWVLPGVLLFDGCRTRKRIVMALTCTLLLYFLISVQVIKAMPVEAVTSDSKTMMSKRKRLNEEVGYASTDTSVMLAGSSWGMLAAMALIRKKKYQVMLFLGAGVIAFGQALTGGRGGYLAWGTTGLVMCLFKWHRYLLLAPVLMILLPILFPAAAERMLMGFGATDVTGQKVIDEEALGAGRLLVWPYVIEKIGKSPLIGYGRLAMKRTGLYDRIETEHPGTGAPHPHNMYLETLLDNGIIGSLPILSFFALVVFYSARLFRSGNRLFTAVGGLSLALVLSSMVGGLTGQHVYPQEHTLGIWAAIFLTLRVSEEDKRMRQATFIPVSMV